jgi:hypothetical protein
MLWSLGGAEVQVTPVLDRATAEQVSVATVVTLAERMSHDELGRLGARLPAELQGALGLARRRASPLTPMSSSAGSPNGWRPADGGKAGGRGLSGRHLMRQA